MYPHTDVDNILKIKSIYTAFEQKPEKNYCFKGEYHNFWEIVIVQEGEVGISAGSDIHILKKGQAFLHEPMEFHSLWNEGKKEPHIIILSFEATDMPECSSRFFEIEDVEYPKKLLRQIRTAFIFNDICAEGITHKELLDYQLAVKNLEIFLLKTIANGTSENPVIKTRMARNYSLIINVLEKNVHKNLSISEIAHLCNMSEVNLKKTFSKYTGVGIMNYFNRLKMNKAVALLSAGMSVGEVADALGFSNQNYFSTAFKRITGNSPSFYK